MAYVGIGALATGFLFAVFPPVDGYQPSRWLMLLAAFTFVILWPFIGLIGVGYWFGQLTRQNSKEIQEPTWLTPHVQKRFLHDEKHLLN
ncbi:MAG: hypothetical protein GY768_10020 [Planctomycetaceae bacterium]|nr:hypothetical protein [Planctomycetaceae bacterium]